MVLAPLSVALLLLFPLGTPVGLALGLWLGALVTKPIRRLPQFNVDAVKVYNEPNTDDLIAWADEED
jgi:hypothetical protein